MGQRMQTEIFIIFVSFAYFLLQSKNGYSSKVLVKNVSLYVYLKSFWSKICKYFCKMVMRIAKNCQNFSYPKNRHFEFFSKIFLEFFFSVTYIENSILTKILYDNFQIFSIMLIYLVMINGKSNSWYAACILCHFFNLYEILNEKLKTNGFNAFFYKS